MKKPRTRKKTGDKRRRIVKVKPPLMPEVLNNMLDCVAVIDEDYTYQYLNRAAERLFGNVVGEKCYRVTRKLESPCHHKGIRCEVHELLEKNYGFFEETRQAETSTGKVFHVRASPISKVGGKRGVVVVFRDVTEQQKNIEMLESLRRELQEKINLMQRVIDNIPSPIFYKDVNGIYRGCNVAYEKYVGLPKEKIVGRNVYEIHPKELADIYYEKDNELIRNPGIQVYETRNIYADGTWHDVIFNKATYRGPDGRVAGIVGVITDITELKNIEKSLKESEQQFRQTSTFLNNVLSQMSDLVEIIDEEYTIRFLNEAAKKIFGDVVGEKCYRVMRNFDRPCHYEGLRCEVRELLEVGGNLFEETRLIPTVNRVVSIRATSTSMPDGKKAAIIVSRDVTGEKEAADRLRESERRYRTLFEESRDAIGITTPEGRYVDVNRAYADLLGYTKEELLKIDVYETYVSPEDRRRLLQEIELKGSVKDYEVKRRRKDGSEIYCLVTSTPIRSDDGHIVGYQTIIRDVTERKRMVEELQSYSERLEALVEERTRKLRESMERERQTSTFLGSILSQMSDYVFLIDEDYNVRFVNRSVNEIFGPVEGEKCYRAFRGLDRPCHHTGILCEVHELLHKGMNYLEDIRQTGPRITHIRSVPTVTSDGRRAILTVSRDVTELKEAEKKMRLMERLSAIGEAAAMIGHDLRNPLQSVVSSIYLAKMKIGAMTPPFKKIIEDSDILEIFNTLESQAKYMDKIVTDLYEFSRPLYPHLAEKNLLQIFDGVISTINIPENIKVTLNVDRETTLKVDPDLIRRLFTNLITNAIQAMPDGGQLTIKTSKNDREVSISFQDTGVGIPEENINRLFDPFFTTKAKGQGLGLSICKRIVEAHEGSISVESKVGVGSTFTVKLPIK
ncbi:MAG: PAS domain S-box protein [Candidatus Bathyarchaeia archaeon]